MRSNCTHAAKALGLSPNRLHRLMCSVSLERVGAGQTKARKRSREKVQDDSRMVDDLLELRRTLLALSKQEKRLATQVGRIHRGDINEDVSSLLIGNGRFKQINRQRRLVRSGRAGYPSILVLRISVRQNQN